MRTFVLALAGAASAALAATPTAAQYYGRPYGYGDRSYGYGYQDISGLQNRIYNVIRGLGGVRPDVRERVRAEAIGLDRELRYAARNGLSPYEEHNFDVRIGRLEMLKGRTSMNGYYGYGNERYGYEGYGYDRRGRHEGWRGDDRDDD